MRERAIIEQGIRLLLFLTVLLNAVSCAPVAQPAASVETVAPKVVAAPSVAAAAPQVAAAAPPQAIPPAGGRPMLHQDFSTLPGGGYRAVVEPEPQRGQRRGQMNWRKRLNAKADFNAAGGQLQLRLKRLPDPVPGETEWDTLFSLVDATGKQVLTAYLVLGVPESYVGPSRNGLHLYSETMPPEVWGFWWPFPSDLRIGQEYSLELRWNSDGTAVLLDGKVLPSGYLDFLGKQGLHAGGGTPGVYFKTIRLLQVGADPFPGDNSPLDANLLIDFTIY